MAVTSKLGSTMLSRAIRPAFVRPIVIRPFSTTQPSRADDGSPVRRNPLVGNLPPARPAQHAKTSRSQTTPPPPPPQGTEPSAAAAAPEANQQPEHTYDATANKNSGYVDIAKLLDNHAAAYAQSANKFTDPLSQPRIRCAPVSGRTIFLEGNPRLPHAAHNPEHAFNLLRRTVRNGNVKGLWHRQRFHERPGLRRKRLKSERWRKRFKEGFQATAARVRELTKQGW